MLCIIRLCEVAVKDSPPPGKSFPDSFGRLRLFLGKRSRGFDLLLSESVRVAELVELVTKFAALYESRRFITVFKKSRHLALL
jgi:hypothetical protein